MSYPSRDRVKAALASSGPNSNAGTTGGPAACSGRRQGTRLGARCARGLSAPARPRSSRPPGRCSGSGRGTRAGRPATPGVLVGQEDLDGLAFVLTEGDDFSRHCLSFRPAARCWPGLGLGCGRCAPSGFSHGRGSAGSRACLREGGAWGGLGLAPSFSEPPFRVRRHLGRLHDRQARAAADLGLAHDLEPARAGAPARLGVLVGHRGRDLGTLGHNGPADVAGRDEGKLTHEAGHDAEDVGARRRGPRGRAPSRRWCRG